MTGLRATMIYSQKKKEVTHFLLKEGKQCQKNPDSNTINYRLTVNASSTPATFITTLFRPTIPDRLHHRTKPLHRWVHVGRPTTRPLNEKALEDPTQWCQCNNLLKRQQAQGAEKEPNEVLTDYRGPAC